MRRVASAPATEEEPWSVEWLTLDEIAAELGVPSARPDPAVGKFTLSVDIAARITLGTPWPDGAEAVGWSGCPRGSPRSEEPPSPTVLEVPAERLSDDAVVVRGGQSRDVHAHVEKITDALEDWGIPALSVYIVEPGDGSFDEAVMAASVCGDVPHGQVQVARLGDLRAAGFDPVLDTSGGQPVCHHNVIFGNEVQPEDAERFIRCFDEPIANPTGGKKRRTS